MTDRRPTEDRKISIPLDLDDALRAVLKVKPTEKPKRKPARKPRRQPKQT